MFTAFPTYDRYRTLRLMTPHQHGEDVFALQTALRASLTTDGVFGPLTAAAVIAAQRQHGLVVDGLAGGKTQEALALECALLVGARYELPPGALRGQLEHESGFRLGAYSPLRGDGSYDAGVAQRNTRLTPAAEGFVVPGSIAALGARIRQHYDLFAGVETSRRWGLAQGSWNAPAFACFIAREEGAVNVKASQCLKPTDAQRKTFEAYVAAVNKYVS